MFIFDKLDDLHLVSGKTLYTTSIYSFALIPTIDLVNSYYKIIDLFKELQINFSDKNERSIRELIDLKENLTLENSVNLEKSRETVISKVDNDSWDHVIKNTLLKVNKIYSDRTLELIENDLDLSEEQRNLYKKIIITINSLVLSDLLHNFTGQLITD